MHLETRGLTRILAKLAPRVVATPLKRFLTRAAVRLEAAGKRRAPVDTGRLRNSLTHQVDSRTPPLWARVGTNVQHKGFPYPLALDAGGWEDGSGSHTYHYRGGGAMGLSGQPTEGWLTQHAVEDAHEDVSDYLHDVGLDIRSVWSR